MAPVKTNCQERRLARTQLVTLVLIAIFATNWYVQYFTNGGEPSGLPMLFLILTVTAVGVLAVMSLQNFEAANTKDGLYRGLPIRIDLFRPSRNQR